MIDHLGMACKHVSPGLSADPDLSTGRVFDGERWLMLGHVQTVELSAAAGVTRSRNWSREPAPSPVRGHR